MPESMWAQDYQDGGRAIWVVTLTDGSVIYQDDESSVSWLSLQSTMGDRRIRSVRLKFRTEWFCGVPEESAGYYYSKGVGGVVGGSSRHFITIGYVIGKVLRTVQVSVPDLQVISSDERPIPVDDPRYISNGGEIRE